MPNKLDPLYLKLELNRLAALHGLPNITVWKQGRFIDSPRYRNMSQEEKDRNDKVEKMTIRPHGGVNNALFMVRHNEDEANITSYLQDVGELLERLTES